jgi:hypothetical protein
MDDEPYSNDVGGQHSCPGAGHEATNTLHRAMCLALYLPGSMVVAIVVESVTSYIKE